MNEEYKLGNLEKLTVALRVPSTLEISLASRTKQEACMLQVAQVVIAVISQYLTIQLLVDIFHVLFHPTITNLTKCESVRGPNETANQRRTMAKKMDPNWGVKVFKLKLNKGGGDGRCSITLLLWTAEIRCG
ncbi:hypothetical protein X801_06312 [Opisthorchis viverrini]|uniref:Uncharacterized protein n=2 Tax=Opisthorchis viverrini TaxID=6198 RepID=A0A075AHC5_OPIVI|nr:hypothetical protein T265_03755 [Opisthorchis viverrini]KER29644.1 hypothetical protein T265_03755 [Opisthorchis viverrini]OON17847.1 hypothetical protein X801_06312 [Opisthorchis viverrini]